MAAVLDKLIQSKSSWKDEDGNALLNTLLVFACEVEDHQAMEKILDKIAEMDDDRAVDPLVFASINGHTEIVELLLAKKDAHVDKSDTFGRTALLYASYKGHMDVVQLLLAKNADVDNTDINGCTALMCAANKGHVEICQLLLHTDVEKADTDGITALIYAAFNGHPDVVRLLLTQTVSVVRPLAKNADVDRADNVGSTPLMFAADSGRMEVVKLLLANQADANKADNRGITALIIAAGKCSKEVVDLLLANDADLDNADNIGDTALVVAIRRDRPDIVTLLINAGANPLIPIGIGQLANYAKYRAILSNASKEPVRNYILMKAKYITENVSPMGIRACEETSEMSATQAWTLSDLLEEVLKMNTDVFGELGEMILPKWGRQVWMA